MAELQLKIVQGEDKTINVTLEKKLNGGLTTEPFDLTGVTAVRAKFAKADKTTLTILLAAGVTVIEPKQGKIKIDLTDANTSVLKTGFDQAIEVEVDIGTVTTIFQIEKILTVTAKLFN